MNAYYAIEIIGTIPRARYCIKRVERDDRFGPVSVRPVGLGRRTYHTELDARDAAERLGIEITKVGDFYQII